MNADPFVHHPDLRGLITDPEKSFFRNFRPADIDARMKALGRPDGWRHTDEEIEAARLAFLAERLDSDLWIFAYGSLMWDPGFNFAEVRRANAPRHARKFILKDSFGPRGCPEAPGLMAALDDGEGCDGLAFRSDDILKWNGNAWSKFFDGSSALLEPNKAKHNVNAFWIPDPNGDDVVMSFGQNRRHVPNLAQPIDGMDLVWWNGTV